jgi:hypothetical protein
MIEQNTLATYFDANRSAFEASKALQSGHASLFETLRDAKHLTDDEKLFGYNAVYSFILVADALKNADKLQHDAYEAILEGLSNAVTDISHGIKHWSNVFTAGVAIRDEFLVSGDVELGNVSDDEIFIRAVLHDSMESLPIISEDGRLFGSLEETYELRKTYHPSIIAFGVRRYAPILGIQDEKAVEMLVYDLAFHNIADPNMLESQQGQVSRLSPAGIVLKYADHYGGAGLTGLDNESIRMNIKNSIARNFQFHEGSWYLINPNIEPEERLLWKSRTGGRFDGLSALLDEFYRISKYLLQTKLGQDLASKRKEEFLNILKEFYGTEYETHQKMLASLSSDTAATYEIAVRKSNKSGDVLRIADTEDAKQIGGLYTRPLMKIIPNILTTPMSHIHTEDGQPSYGWSILYKDEFYDPSILQFASREELEKKLDELVTDYEDGLRMQ